VLALVALVAWAFAPKPVEVELGTVVEGPFEVTVDEDGKTRLADRYVVSAPLAGRLSRSALREGDAVESGAVVATLSPSLSPMLDERSLREQTARVDAAEAMVQRALARIDRARVGIAQVDVELKHDEQLAKDGFIAPTKLQADRLAVQAAQRELEAAQQDHHVAGHDLEQARAALGALRQPAGGAGARDFVVRAPIAGQVLRVLQPSEGNVALGTPLLELGDLGRLEVVAQLLTGDALQAQAGTPVRIERWGGPSVLAGRVRRVEPAAFTKVSALGVEEQRVNVLIDITSPHAQWQALGDGFRVGVRIVTLAAPRALKAPVSAVFPAPGSTTGEMAAFVVDGGRVRQVPVVLRARNGSDAWVTSGLAAGERVVVYPPTTVRDGVRVKERRS
jgi:HlyD family secretion protein